MATPVHATGMGSATRVGADGRKIPGAAARGPIGALDYAKDLGMDGVFFRTVLEMSPTLDPGELSEIRKHADELDLYLETGLGKVNPYAIPEAPELRAIGDGDTLLGFERMIRACAEIGCLELWAGTANFKPYRGRLAYDRFRTDVDWSDQLGATEKFLTKLAPIARHHDVHVNLETHEEITSFEVVRLVEAVGPDAIGIVFDTSNPLQRAEDPVAVAGRVAPYVRQTHFKDAALCFVDGGVQYEERTVGKGVIDFAAIVPLLLQAKPDLNLSIEGAQPWDEATETYPTFTAEQIPFKNQTIIEAFDRDWLAAHPDLNVAELSQFFAVVLRSEAAIAEGTIPALGHEASTFFGASEAADAIVESARYLRALLAGPEANRGMATR